MLWATCRGRGSPRVPFIFEWYSGGAGGGAAGRTSNLLSLPGGGAVFLHLAAERFKKALPGGEQKFSGKGVPMQAGAEMPLPGGRDLEEVALGKVGRNLLRRGPTLSPGMGVWLLPLGPNVSCPGAWNRQQVPQHC